MRQIFNEMTFLVGNSEELDNLSNVKALPVFSEQILDFLMALSKELLTDKETKQYSDLTAYAFWIRKASLNQMKESFQTFNRIGRGVSFHIAPSNVPVAFAMSLTAGLLAGNACVVRVSNKEFAQINIFIRAVRRLLDSRWQELTQYLYLLRYDHNTEITEYLSSLSDVRIIWGGNHTVDTIRSTHLPPRAVELTFADRYSLAIIDAEQYLEADTQKVVDNFYLDTYYSDQGACSAPRLVFWIGKHIEQAQENFWETLEKIIKERYNLQDIQCIDKLDAFCRIAMKYSDIRKSGDGFLTRIFLPKLYPDCMDYKENGGFFFEYYAKSLDELVPILKKPCQTIAYFGVEPDNIRQVIFKYGVQGVDRIVPLGQTMELSLIWDGFNLVESMSRIVA